MGIYEANTKRLRKIISDSFIEMLYVKKFEKISVNALLIKTEINRSTFYKYFSDKYDLARYTINKIVEEYVSIIERNKDYSPQTTFADLYKYLEINRKQISAVLTIKDIEVNASAIFLEGLQKIYKTKPRDTVFSSSLKSYYFANIYYVPMYLFITNEKISSSFLSSSYPAEEYAKNILDASLDVFSNIFHINPAELSALLQKTKGNK